MPHNTPRRRAPRAFTRVATALAAASAILGASIVLAPAAVAAPPTVGPVTITSTETVRIGDAVAVTVPLAAPVVDLYAYTVTVEFDPALLSYALDSAVFPAGGVDLVSQDTGSITFTHTRLGTSPGLVEPLDLVTFSFTALAAGEAAISVADATFVSSTTESVELAEPVGTVTTISAAPTASPTPTASATPIADSGAGSGSATNDPLANTGQDATVWIIVGAVAAVAAAAGVVLLLRRRAVNR